jgi:hypothetical protein
LAIVPAPVEKRDGAAQYGHWMRDDTIEPSWIASDGIDHQRTNENDK